MFQIRKAKATDVPQIYALLKELGEKGLMLPRSLSEIYDVIRAFFIAHPTGSPEKVIGACAMQVCWQDLGEIRSLSVSQEYRGYNLGKRLVEACEEDARELGLNRLFVLTYIPDFFIKINYQLIDKSQLPHKIWADCLKCVKFPECGEIAMEKKL